jgi:hypothetical protein
MVRKAQGLTGPALAAALLGWSPLAPAADLDGSMFVEEAVLTHRLGRAVDGFT